MKEFKDFQEFYNYGYSLTKNIKSKTCNFLASERVEFARNNIYKSDLNYIVIDNNHYDGRGKVANTANWMVHYITSYHFINLGDREREVTITISGHGVVACFAVDSNGYIINDSEQFSLFDKESGKVIVHDFTYTTKIGAKSEVKVYVEHNLLANSYGNVIHKAYLN